MDEKEAHYFLYNQATRHSMVLLLGVSFGSVMPGIGWMSAGEGVLQMDSLYIDSGEVVYVFGTYGLYVVGFVQFS